MASAVASGEDSNTSTDQEDHVSPPNPSSLPSSLPFEMVEAILVHLSAPDLLFAAANVPEFWRDVIATSKEVWKILARHRYDNDNDAENNAAKIHAILRDELSIFNQTRKTIKCFSLKGILFAHRDSFGNAGLIFAPGSDNAPLVILDVMTSSLRYQKKGRTGCWYLELYDVNGNLVCKQEVRDDTKSVLGRYFQAIVEDRKIMERYLRGSRFIDQVPDPDGGGKHAKRRKRGSD